MYQYIHLYEKNSSISESSFRDEHKKMIGGSSPKL